MAINMLRFLAKHSAIIIWMMILLFGQGFGLSCYQCGSRHQIMYGTFTDADLALSNCPDRSGYSAVSCPRFTRTYARGSEYCTILKGTTVIESHTLQQTVRGCSDSSSDSLPMLYTLLGGSLRALRGGRDCRTGFVTLSRKEIGVDELVTFNGTFCMCRGDLCNISARTVPALSLPVVVVGFQLYRTVVPL